MRWPARRTSRAAASSGSAMRRVSKRNCAAVASLLTFCPPGPEARTKPISMSFSSIVRLWATRSMVSPERKYSQDINRRHPEVRALTALLRRQSERASKDECVAHPSRLAALAPQDDGGVCGKTLVCLRGRRGRLGGGLRGAADDHGEQTLSPQPLRGLFGIVQRYGIDDGVALFDVVDR